VGTGDMTSGRRRSPWGRVFGLDLVLLHAPSVWDFRRGVILQGPLADVIPSTDEFEMYPIGLTSIAAYLEQNHYDTRLVNLAYRMLRRPRFDVARHIARLDAPVFGIDLHWLPHAHGALGIAELVKQLHPESKSDPLASYPGQRPLRSTRKVRPVQCDRTRRGPVQARRAVQQRGLARARGSHHGGEAASLEAQRDVAARSGGGASAAVPLGHPGQADHVFASAAA
jgi:hypothetical protein